MRHDVHARDRQQGTRAYYLMLRAVCFALLLPVALLARLSGWAWRPWEAGPGGYESAPREAWSQAKRAAAMTALVYH